MAWSRSQKPCETVRSILAKTPSIDVTNPVQSSFGSCLFSVNKVSALETKKCEIFIKHHFNLNETIHFLTFKNLGLV